MNKIRRRKLKTIWWNPKMVEGALFDEKDIPFCPTRLSSLPKKIITWHEAKIINNNELKKGNINYFVDAFVCFNLDDYNFDTSRGIWFCYSIAIEILKHYKGIITPDFSTYSDFPEPFKLFNTYRMRAFGFACWKEGLEVINNVRGRENDDFEYCFLGIEKNSIVAIGTVGSGLQYTDNRSQFEEWLSELIARLSPKIIIIYGSANYQCLNNLEKQGIKIVQYDSYTAKKYKLKKEIKKYEKI